MKSSLDAWAGNRKSSHKNEAADNINNFHILSPIMSSTDQQSVRLQFLELKGEYFCTRNEPSWRKQ